jgi:hypothetical protein
MEYQAGPLQEDPPPTTDRVVANRGSPVPALETMVEKEVEALWTLHQRIPMLISRARFPASLRRLLLRLHLPFCV